MPKKKLTSQQREQIKRDLLFVPCTSKKNLHTWIKVYLGLDLPDCIVCDDEPHNPPSNSSPMDLVWELYSKALDGTDENFQQVLAYAARGAFKTLSCSILEILSVLHLNRNVAHAAAIESQAAVCGQYIAKYFRRPYLKDYLSSKNKRLIEVTRYIDSNGKNIPQAEYDNLTPEEQGDYTHKSHWMKIIVCTMGGMNSTHAPFLCVDGDTNILVRSKDPARQRTKTTARGLFRTIAGLEPSGRSGQEYDFDVPVPKEYVEVLTFNNSTGQLEFNRVLRGHRAQRDTIKVEYDSTRSLVCTNDHPLLVVGKGFTQAGQLKVGDKLVAKRKGMTLTALKKGPCLTYIPPSSTQSASTEWEQVLLGSLLGDMGIYKKVRGNPYVYEQHCLAQSEYLTWKWQILGQKLRYFQVKNAKSGYTNESQLGFQSGQTPILLPYKDLRNDLSGLSSLEAQGLAVWYMDDGCAGNQLRLSTEGFSLEQNKSLVAFLKSRFDLDISIMNYTRDIDGETKTYNCLIGSVAAKRKLVDICKPFIHPSLAYKFDLERNYYNCIHCDMECFYYELGNTANTCSSPVCRGLSSGSLVSYPITSITDAGSRWVFDFTVENNGNFFTNGVLSKNCLDELDLVDPKPLEESRAIPSKGEKGELPITFLTSSRKFSFGEVQKALDNAHKTGLVVRHWNILDVTERCLPSRHLPEEPKIPIYYNEDTLASVSKEDWEMLDSEAQTKWHLLEGYAGCLSRCSIFSICKGRLATKQTSTSPLLISIPEVKSKVLGASPEFVKAQLLCFAPGTQILMADGSQKSIEQVRVGDRVITHLGNVRTVTHTLIRHYAGEVLAVSQPTWMGFGPTIVTPEHPYYINGNEFRSIGQVRQSTTNKQRRTLGDYFSLPKNYEASGPVAISYRAFVDSGTHTESDGLIITKTKTSRCRPIPASFQLTEEFGWILGFYLAEGHISTRQYAEDGPEYITAITFATHVNETAFHQKLRSFAASIGLTTSESNTAVNGYSIDIYNSALAPLFLALCGRHCDKKRLHPDLMNAGIDFLRGVLNGYFDGDGTKRENNYKELTSTSYHLASQLFVIAARLGLCPRLKKKPAAEGFKQVYLLWYSNPGYVYKQKRTKFLTSETFNLYRCDDVACQAYVGDVYNLEVDEDNSYIANGLAVHNCWKPSAEGLIYPYLSRERHVITAAEMAEKITGEAVSKRFTKADLVYLMVRRGMTFHLGMDFGFTHNFATTFCALDGNRLFIIDCSMVKGLELPEKIELCKSRYFHYNPTVYPDDAYPSDIKSFRRAGFRCKDFNKDVLGGIDAVRSKLMPGFNKEPEMFFLAGEPGVEALFSQMQKYHWTIETDTENATEIPDKTDDDGCDSLRYVCQNLFGAHTKFTAAVGDYQSSSATPTQKNWLQREILKRTGGQSGTTIRGKKGGFYFNGG
jgi:intein/homing endonuclease